MPVMNAWPLHKFLGVISKREEMCVGFRSYKQGVGGHGWEGGVWPCYIEVSGSVRQRGSYSYHTSEQVNTAHILGSLSRFCWPAIVVVSVY